jgi:hypothetical protein
MPACFFALNSPPMRSAAKLQPVPCGRVPLDAANGLDIGHIAV